MIKKFINLNTSDPLKQLVMDNIDDVYATQNDADEIITRKAFIHIKNCEIRKNVRNIYFPSFSFKRNYYWLEPTSDMMGLNG
jgi:hypothetical protein